MESPTVKWPFTGESRFWRLSAPSPAGKPRARRAFGAFYVPYLTSVSSPARSRREISCDGGLPQEEFRQKLAAAFPDAALEGGSDGMVTEIVRSDAWGHHLLSCGRRPRHRDAASLRPWVSTAPTSPSPSTARRHGDHRRLRPRRGHEPIRRPRHGGGRRRGEDIVLHYYTGCVIGDLSGVHVERRRVGRYSRPRRDPLYCLRRQKWAKTPPAGSHRCAMLSPSGPPPGETCPIEVPAGSNVPHNRIWG